MLSGHSDEKGKLCGNSPVTLNSRIGNTTMRLSTTRPPCCMSRTRACRVKDRLQQALTRMFMSMAFMMGNQARVTYDTMQMAYAAPDMAACRRAHYVHMHKGHRLAHLAMQVKHLHSCT